MDDSQLDQLRQRLADTLGQAKNFLINRFDMSQNDARDMLEGLIDEWFVDEREGSAESLEAPFDRLFG